MNSTDTTTETAPHAALRLARDLCAAQRERREHDSAMRDRGIANEHQIQIGRALARGELGCSFCGVGS